MPISALPTPPSRADSPSTFSSRADALLGALPTFVTETNAVSDDMNTKYAAAMAAGLADAAANAQSADASEAAALAAKIQAEYARDQALAGLGAADNSQILSELAGSIGYAVDIAGRAAADAQPYAMTDIREILANQIMQCADIAGASARLAQQCARVVAAPANASAPGTVGEWAWDSGFIYVCTALNTWKRVAIATW